MVLRAEEAGEAGGERVCRCISHELLHQLARAAHQQQAQPADPFAVLVAHPGDHQDALQVEQKEAAAEEENCAY